MTTAEWRALIEAFLEGRLSAEAFERRFMQAWREERDARGSAPPAIEALFSVVEAYTARQDERTQYDADETEMREAARTALRQLREDAAHPTRTFDRARAREDMRRFQVRMGRVAGVGCLFVIGWIVLMILQINFAIEQINAEFNLGTWLSAIVGFFVGLVPILGNIVAFFGARDVGEWPAWLAALVFFGLPLLASFGGGWRWRRWRERR